MCFHFCIVEFILRRKLVTDTTFTLRSRASSQTSRMRRRQRVRQYINISYTVRYVTIWSETDTFERSPWIMKMSEDPFAIFKTRTTGHSLTFSLLTQYHWPVVSEHVLIQMECQSVWSYSSSLFQKMKFTSSDLLVTCQVWRYSNWISINTEDVLSNRIWTSIEKMKNFSKEVPSTKLKRTDTEKLQNDLRFEEHYWLSESDRRSISRRRSGRSKHYWVIERKQNRKYFRKWNFIFEIWTWMQLVPEDDYVDDVVPPWRWRVHYVTLRILHSFTRNDITRERIFTDFRSAETCLNKDLWRGAEKRDEIRTRIFIRNGFTSINVFLTSNDQTKSGACLTLSDVKRLIMSISRLMKKNDEFLS